MATHSSILTSRIPWTQETDGFLRVTKSQTNTCTFTYRARYQPIRTTCRQVHALSWSMVVLKTPPASVSGDQGTLTVLETLVPYWISWEGSEWVGGCWASGLQH